MIDPQDDRDIPAWLKGLSKRGPDLRVGDDPRWASLRYDGSPGATEVGLKDRAQRLEWPTIGLEIKKPKTESVSPAAAPSCTCQCRCDEATAPVEDVAAFADEATASAGEVAAPFDEPTAPPEDVAAPLDGVAPPFGGATASAGGATASGGQASAVDGGGGLVDLDPFTLDGGKTGEQVLADARAVVEAAVDALLALDVASADGAAIRSHAVGMQQLVNKANAAHVAAAGALDLRGAYIPDGAVNAQAWLRNRIRSDHGEALRLVKAGGRLRQFPQLEATFRAGGCSLSHVTAVTHSAVPSRVAALADNDEVFAELAQHATPKDMARAVKHVRDLVDPDGTTTNDDDGGQRVTGLDPRRGLHLSRTMDDLWELRATLDPLQGEALKTVLDALDQPDPADTPQARQRSPSQRRVDALALLATTVLDAGLTPAVQGHKPHLLVMVDLQTLLGNPDLATFDTEAKFTGQIDLDDLLRVFPDCRYTPVLTDGPWRAVSVGRTQRSLPGWMRPVMEALHRRCRGPDCDRPVSWTEAHHTIAWADNGDTDLNVMVPLCKRHHDLVTTGTWHVTYCDQRGVCTWTNTTTNRKITTKPPPRGSPTAPASPG